MVDNSVPAIRTFQMDGQEIGKLPSAVNLFRGDVNLTQSLLTLPGRTEGSGLDLSLTLQYQSNVTETAQLWNRDAPTGILGLGWTFPLNYIYASDSGSPVPGTRQYTLYENGSPNSLYRQPNVPVLFTLPSDDIIGLKNGTPISSNVLAGFHGVGLPLSSTAVISGSGPWTIDDAELQQIFTITSENGELSVRNGGEFYALENYKFYNIVYYPTYERWVVVTESGMVRSYGGNAADTDKGYRTAVNNSIAWSVWWRPDGQSPSWTGTSGITDGQVQVASAWYLATTSNRFGDKVAYAYNGWDRDASTGLIPGAEQLVGMDGLPFTKAVYLTGLTDVFGRTVDLAYGDKLWSDGDTDPREYADPNNASPNNDPSPFQDRYETRYLSGLTVRDTTGATLLSYAFRYNPRPDISGPAAAVANVTDNTGRLLGDTYKRFLTGIVMTYADGTTAPPLLFTYYLDSSTGYAPGALKAITYPEGAVATYAYTSQNLDACDRTVTAARPSSLGDSGSPRVFFGSDYAVVTYYNPNCGNGTLTLQIYTWVGTWLTWTLSDDAVLDTKGLELDTLEVLADRDFMALHFTRLSGGSPQRVVYVFQKDIARQGQWQAAVIDGTTTAPDTPSLTYDNVQLDLGFVSGATFFLVSNIAVGGKSNYFDRVTFRWTTRAWTVERIAVTGYSWIAGRTEYYATLDDGGTLSVNYLDGDLEWQSAPSATVPGLITTDVSNVEVEPGDGLVVVSNLQTTHSFQLSIIQWDAAYRPTVTQPPTVSFYPGSGTTTSTLFTPTIVDDTLIAVNGALYRYNGKEWLSNSQLTPPATVTDTRVRYAYGPDYAIQILAPKNSVTKPTASALGFDPGTNTTTWSQTGTAMAQTLPAQTSDNQNWPAAGGADWAVAGPYVYFRGENNNWGAVVGTPATIDISQLLTSSLYVLNSEALINEAPSFLSFVTMQGASPVAAEAVILRNGQQFGGLTSFSDQKMTFPGTTGGGGKPGTYAGGSQMFMTYPTSAPDFNSADKVYLNRFAGSALQGNIRHFAVASLTIAYGYESSVKTLYVFDTATATCDPTGKIIKYFTSRMYPNTSEVSDPVNGYTENTYLNGLNVAQGNYYNMLDGMLQSTGRYDRDGQLREATTSAYNVFETVSDTPERTTTEGVPLRGGFVAPVTTKTYKDGLTQVKTSSYVASGQPGPFSSTAVSQQTNSCNADGQLQTFTNGTTFGVQVYAGLRAIHALVDPAEQYDQVTPVGDGNGEIPIQSKVTTYKPWPTTYGDTVTAWSGEAQFGLESATAIGFPFDSYSPGGAQAGWTLAVRTTKRTALGMEAETVNALGVPTGTIYARNDLFPIAQCPNASAAGMVYSDFQPYDPLTGWTFQETAFSADIARTGVRSLTLPGDAHASATVTITPHQADMTYVAGCWYRTASGFTPEDGSGLSATVTVDGVAHPAVTLPFETTDSEWTYRTLTIPVPAGGTTSATVSITLSLSNDTAADVNIDAILLVPLANGLTGRTFDQTTHAVLASMEASGETNFSYYNDANRVALAVGPTGAVQEISLNFLSRSGTSGGDFDPASPNAEVTANAAGASHVETFRSDGAWKNRWSPDDAAAWTTAGGVITHAGSADGTLTWSGASPAGAYAVYFEVVPDDQSTIRIAFGDITVAFDGKTYTGSQGTGSWTPLASPLSLARQWLAIAGQGQFLFFAGGQLLFSRKATPSSATVTITVGGASTGLKNLVLANDVRLGVVYNDASGRQRQAHQLSGDDSLIVQTVNDGFNRVVATTKAAPGSFGSGGDLATMQYSPGFADVSGFLANLDTSWEMGGDVADYYRGQKSGGVTRSDDQGYPYYGARFEASPRDIIVETSSPGKNTAINLTVPADQRQTVQIAYGAANANASSAEYETRTTTSPVKVKATTFNDMLSQQVRSENTASDGSGTLNSKGLRTYSTEAGGPLLTFAITLPNALTTGPQSGDSDYVRTAVSNPLQLPTSAEDTDAGLTRFIHDSVGNLRFVQPAPDTGETWFIYYRYDPVNRMVEQGTVAAAWDSSALRQKADDPSYPSTDNTVSTIWVYDGDGSVPAAIGHKSSSVTSNPAPANDSGAGELTVNTTYGYGASGQLTSVATTLSGADTTSGTVTYVYNALNEVVEIGYPTGASLPKVFYRHDQLGHVVSIGSSQGASDIGAFTFAPDGTVATQELGGGAWTQTTELNSNGNPVSVETVSRDGSQTLAMAFDYGPDSVMISRDIRFGFTGVTDRYLGTLGYDGQRRFNSLTGTQSQSVTSFDPNGNIWTGNTNGDAVAFTYESGSDRIASATIGDNSTSFNFNARGQQTSGSGRTLAYDSCTAMTVSVASDANTIRLAYGDSRQRVLKQVRAGTGASRVYFHGASTAPLAVFSDGEWATFVQGPTGLLAMQQGARLAFPLKDPTRSTWALIDDKGLLAHYAYMPYGQQIVASPGDAGIFSSLYQGQEWDDEVGLYNFRARLYDPVQMRFLAPDPENQFPSPYIFAGSVPFTACDPSGMISTWAQIGIGVAMVTVTVAGIALTPFSGSASDEIAVSADSALAGAEVAAGAATAEAAATTVAGSALATIGNSVFSGTLVGGGLSGLQYDIEHGRDFTAKGFFTAAGIGAAAGAASGLASGGVSAFGSAVRASFEAGDVTAKGILARAATNAAVGIVSGAVSSDVSTIVTNLFENRPWYQNLGTATLEGAGKGLAQKFGTSLWQQRTNIANLKNAGGMTGKVGQSMAKFNTKLDALKRAATTSNAYVIYGFVGFHIAGGYAAWGAYENTKS